MTTAIRHATLDLVEDAPVRLVVDILADTPGIEIEGDDETFDVVLVRPGIAPSQGDPITEAVPLPLFYGTEVTVESFVEPDAFGYPAAVVVRTKLSTVYARAVEFRFQGDLDAWRQREGF